MSGALTAVAMSGGLDSSVAAWLLAERGDGPVVGLSMLLWAEDPAAVARPANGRCCGALDLGDAKRVAQQAGIPHYTLRLDEEFRRAVVDPFVDDYLAGRTPSPCVRCNTWVKFDLLLERARRFGAERLATGHYARLVDGPAGRELHVAARPDKDQSYFLFELDQEQLAASRFPLGELGKDEVRDIARRAGLVVAEKGESMEICFVADDVRSFVEREAAGRAGAGSAASAPVALEEPSTVVDTAGRELGRGAPYYRYTVGQRRGLGVSSPSGERLYVLALDPARNRVTVGRGEEAGCRAFTGERLHWINPELDLAETAGVAAATAGVEVTVKIRARHSGVAGRVRPLADGRAEVELAEPQRGVAPGQAAVFYRGTRVAGGCWIEGPR
ncbi:MAG TPA: tRNA 2-thiouridine(34) synthase MnmA [Thermoanaerobaculia bacterium]|nr:tRNA 2-thiouridine(34) synthase MnmA [Thermoanaerobaculia bacterium]